jgi:hypothetical protein
MLLFSSTTLLRNMVQRGISVDVKGFGSGRFLSIVGQAPFWGGGPSPGFSEFGAIPSVLWLNTDFSMIRFPPEFEPE